MAAGTRGKGRPSRTQAAEIDRAIREGALQVMIEHGEAATMHAIAQAAGISRKSLYARHANKEALFLDLIREVLTSADALEYDSSGTAEQRLGNYIAAATSVFARPESYAFQHVLRLDPDYSTALRDEMLAATRKIFLEPLVILLTEAKASGELVIEDVEATARAAIQLIFGEGLRPGNDLRHDPEQSRANDYAAFLTRLLTRGLAPRKA